MRVCVRACERASLCLYALIFSSCSPVKPGLNGLKAASNSPLLPVVNCQTCVVDDGTTKDIIF